MPSQQSLRRSIIPVIVFLIVGVLFIAAGAAMLGVGIHKIHQSKKTAESCTCPSASSTFKPLPTTEPARTSTLKTETASSPTTLLTSPANVPDCNLTSTTTTTPTTPPTSTTSYDLSSKAVELIFIVDISATAKRYFDDYISFIKNFLNIFTVSSLSNSNFAHVGIYGVSPDPNYEPTYCSLGQLGMDDLSGCLIVIQNSITNKIGQYLRKSLDLVQQSIDDGTYRSRIDNHWIIYLTSATSITQSADAVAKAKFFKDGKYFSFAGISYNGMPRENISIVTGGYTCTYVTNSFSSLTTTVTKDLQQQIFDNQNDLCMSS
ncbi:unnamed protein product, partial [Mesorhabditis belari]|uniref:VWFA domain-containing protein n=1 Tax=Mesorhabditis belari TaxID=2138241 RepID=A0AAF3FJD8_9BILA